MTQKSLQAVFFDLDGTLIDTAPDMALALNRLLVEQGLSALPFERIRQYVSHGALGLIKLGFGIDQQCETWETLRLRFLSLYAEHVCDRTALFTGIEETLSWLEQRGIPWGIVTNKPEVYTRPILDALELNQRMCSVIFGDSLTKRKPHPEPLLAACEKAGVDHAGCVYIGDAERDILAGNAAQMLTMAAHYGYIPDEEDPAAWPAAEHLNTCSDIVPALRRHFNNF